MTSNEAGRVGREKPRARAKLFKLTESAHGTAQQKFASPFGTVQQSGIQFGTKDAGGDRIHANSRLSPLNGKRLGERRHRSLAGAVCRDLEERDKRSQGRDVDDSPVTPLEHVLAEDTTGPQSAVQVGFNDFIPF